MADRPIIFSAPMVRALLDGRKTQTRRVVPRPTDHFHASYTVLGQEGGQHFWSDGRGGMKCLAKVPWAAGDRLWVRENWACLGRGDCGTEINFAADDSRVVQSAQHFDAVRRLDAPGRWRPSIHMPRWASRLTLEVTDVRVERLQDISEADAVAEGVAQYASSTKLYRAFEPEKKGWYRHGFFALWDQIHGPEFTDANPWIAAISFTVHRENIDALDLGVAA